MSVKGFKTLGKGELARRLSQSIELNQIAQDELRKWIEGFTTACAYLKIVEPNHPFLKRLEQSTLAQVDEKIKLINEKRTKDE